MILVPSAIWPQPRIGRGPNLNVEAVSTILVVLSHLDKIGSIDNLVISKTASTNLGCRSRPNKVSNYNDQGHQHWRLPFGVTINVPINVPINLTIKPA